MYLYTPNKKILSDLKRAMKKDKADYGNRVSSMASGYFKSSIEQWNFIVHWQNTKFYSITRRVNIPVNGLLMSASFFDETKVM